MAINFSISELRQLADELTPKLGIPVNQMVHSFLKRRLNYIVDKYNYRKSDQLLAAVEDVTSKNQFRSDFSVETTELFRDPGFWRQLRKILTDKKQEYTVWLPDLGSGEELYSLLILARENDLLDDLKIVANHSSVSTLESVRNGILGNRKMDVNSYNYKRFEGTQSLDNYFRESNNGFIFDQKLLQRIDFVNNGITDVPKTKVDLILFRNSMLYFNKDYHTELKNSFDGILKPGGFLCIGVKEILPEPITGRFECVDPKEKIYSKFSFLKD